MGPQYEDELLLRLVHWEKTPVVVLVPQEVLEYAMANKVDPFLKQGGLALVLLVVKALRFAAVHFGCRRQRW